MAHLPCLGRHRTGLVPLAAAQLIRRLAGRYQGLIPGLPRRYRSIHPLRVRGLLRQGGFRGLQVLCRLVPVSVDEIHLSGPPFPGERASPFILDKGAFVLLLDPREIIRTHHPGLVYPRRWYLLLERLGPIGLQGSGFEDAVGDHSQPAVFLRTVIPPHY